MMSFYCNELLRGPALIAKFRQAMSEDGRSINHVIGTHNLQLMRQLADDLMSIADKNALDAAFAGAQRLRSSLTELEQFASAAMVYDPPPMPSKPLWEVEAESEDDNAKASESSADFAALLVATERSAELDAIVRQIADHIVYLDQAFDDQIGSRFGVILTKEEAKLFDQKSQPLFGNLVYERFPAASDDVAEAGACLAFNRGTAAVFHLMRVMEAGLKGLAREMGVNYAPSWESYIKQLDAMFAQNAYSKLTDEQKRKLPAYRDVLGDLVSVKSAWRNPTMHIVRHYDPSQAKIIFESVQAFMTNLAENLTFDPVLTLSEPEQVV